MPITLGFKKNKPLAKVPVKAHASDAAYDLFSLSSAVIMPGESKALDTGISFDIPSGFAVFVYSRSGHGFKSGIRLANSTGVIDSGYQGAVMVKLHNDSADEFIINEGDKIAQFVLMPIPDVSLVEAKNGFAASERGDGGFGSTGR